MSKKKPEEEIAAGKLISAIQKEWGEEAGEPKAAVSEEVMYLAHDLLQAGTTKSMLLLLGSRSVSEFLGELWVARHPNVGPAISRLERAIAGSRV